MLNTCPVLTDSFTGPGKMIYSLYHQGQERQDFPMFSLTRFFFVSLPDVRGHCWCSSTKERSPRGEQSQWTPFLPVQIPSLEGMDLGMAFRCSSLGGTFPAPPLEVTKATCSSLWGCRAGFGVASGNVPTGAWGFPVQHQETPKALSRRMLRKQGVPPELPTAFVQRNHLYFAFSLMATCFGSWV